MSRKLEVLEEGDTIARAAAIMADAGVGFLPICGRDRKVVGVVTDRDLVTRGLARGLDAKTTSAQMIMTAPALTCLAEAELRSAEELMASERRGRLVVTHEDGTIAGIISLADLVEHAQSRDAVKTVRAVLWREALGPRGGAAPGVTLLKDMPLSKEPLDDEAHSKATIFAGGQHDSGAKEFPS